MRIGFDHSTKALSHSSHRRLTGEANNLNILGFFRISFGGRAFADLSHPSFGCNEANERLNLLHLPPLFPLLPARFFIPSSLLSLTSSTTLPSLSPEHPLTQLWSRPALNARLGH